MNKETVTRSAIAFGLFLLIAVAFAGCGSNSGNPVVSYPAKPAPVTSVLAATAVAGDNQVTLGWSRIAGATSYTVYSSKTASQTGGNAIASVATPSTSYVDTSAVNGITYYYMIEALDGSIVMGRSGWVTATPGAPRALVTISGTMQYQDKEYDAGGFTGSQPSKAVRYASVDLVSGDSVLVSTQTDSNGCYRFLTAPTPTVYVRVHASAAPPGCPSSIEVSNLAGSLYAVRSNSFTASGQADVTMIVPSASVGGAFNILDVLTNGFEFVHTLSSWPAVSLAAFWQQGNSSGTYYCPGEGSGCASGRGIYVSNSAVDTDEYDDDVLYHEFGHFAAAQFSLDQSPGGRHMLTSNDLDMRLAWSEGWGDAMPGSIKRWLFAANPGLISATGSYPAYLTEYVDTVRGGAGISLDIGRDDPGWSPSWYASGELAVAKILLDLGRDYGMKNQWDVAADFRKNRPRSPVNLELFWDRWHSLPATASIPVDSYFSSRRISYSADAFEPDSTPATASVCTLDSPQVRRLYSGWDADFVAITTVADRRYTVSTSSLLNGADTLIQLYNQDLLMQPVSNDNQNGYTSSTYAVPSDDLSLGLCDSYGVCHDNKPEVLSSRMQFQALYSGRYYVKVSSSPQRPASAGRYGTYTLTVTSP